MEPDQIAIIVEGVPTPRITCHSGKVLVVAEDRADVLASGKRVNAETGMDGVIAIAGSGSTGITVRCPVGSAVAIGTTSGGIEARGDLGDVRATSASGRVSIESARRADLRSTAGHVKIDRCVERCRVQTTSGSVEVDRSAATEVSTRRQSPPNAG